MKLPYRSKRVLRDLEQNGLPFLPEKEMATRSSVLAWKVPWTEEPGGLQSRAWQRVKRRLVTTPPPPSDSSSEGRFHGGPDEAGWDGARS